MTAPEAKSLRQEYRQRYIDRGNKPDLVELFDEHFEKWTAAAHAQQGCRHIILQTRQFLSDIVLMLRDQN